MPYSQYSEDDIDSHDTFLSNILKWRNDPFFCQVADVFFGNKSRIASAPVKTAHSSPTKRKFKSATAVGRGHLYSGRATASRATSRNSIPTPYTPTFQLRNGRVTPSSPFISPNDAPKKPNFHVKKPFKHSVKSPRSMSENKGTSPSADLKEKTAFASFQMAKVLAKEQIPPSKKTTGKLLKGRLNTPSSHIGFIGYLISFLNLVQD